MSTNQFLSNKFALICGKLPCWLAQEQCCYCLGNCHNMLLNQAKNFNINTHKNFNKYSGVQKFIIFSTVLHFSIPDASYAKTVHHRTGQSDS